MLIKSLVAVFLAAILTENYVLSKFLGICPFLGVSKKLNTAVGMSVAVTFVMVLATAVTFPIYMYLLIPMGLEYLQTVLFILIIAGLVQLVEIILRKYIPSLYNSLGIYLPLITTNCAVLGVTMLVIQKVDSTSAYTYTYGHARQRVRRGYRLPRRDGDVCRRPRTPRERGYPQVAQGSADHTGRRGAGILILPRVRGLCR